MANTTNNNLSDNCDHKDLSPLLDESIEEHNKKPTKISDTKVAASPPMEMEKSATLELGCPEYEWTANGLPLNHGSVVGEPMGRGSVVLQSLRLSRSQ